LLFILAIDPLQRLLQVATARGLISEVSRNQARLRTSLYADDAVLFIKPVKEEVSSQVLLNGIPGEPFVHGRGLLGGGPALPFALHPRHRPAPEASPGCNGQGANF